MRSSEDKQYLRSRLEDTVVVDEFLNSEEIKELIELYHNKDNKIHKNTGPVVSHLQDEPIFEKLVTKLKPLLGDFKVYSAAYFYVTFPHIIHNDDHYDLPNTFKAITLPLELNYSGNTKELPNLCMFDQYYLDGPAKFFNGSEDIPTYYNKQIYEYSNVENKTDQPFPEDIRLKYLTHLKKSWLEGCSIKSIHQWKPGSAIIFDAVRLHCASDFRQLGISSKLGISIFTYTD
jgi:hypothetical protein